MKAINKKLLYAITLLMLCSVEGKAITITFDITDACRITNRSDKNIVEKRDSLFYEISQPEQVNIVFNFSVKTKFVVQFYEDGEIKTQDFNSQDLSPGKLYSADKELNLKINEHTISFLRPLTITIGCLNNSTLRKILVLKSPEQHAADTPKNGSSTGGIKLQEKHYKPLNPFYDALALAYPGENSVYQSDFPIIIKYYFPYETVEPKFETAYKIARKNPFFNSYFSSIDSNTYKSKFKKSLENKTESGVPVSNVMSSLSLSSLGATDVTNVSKGVSLFLIARAKQELNIAFFEKFKHFIAKYPETRILFPNTTTGLDNLLAYQYSQMLPVLQEAFYKDINKFPDNLVEVMLMDKYYEKIKASPEFRVVINSISLLQQINHMNPTKLIDSLPGIAKGFEKIPKLENLHSSLQLTTIFSNAIRTDSIHYDDSEKNYWISPKEFYDSIINRPVVLNIFLGLIYQQIKTNSIRYNDKPLDSLIIAEKTELLWYKMQLSKLLTQVDNISIAAKSIKQLRDKGNKPTNEDIYAYANTTIDLFEFGYDFASHYNPELKKNTLDKYIELAKNANSLYINTISQKYALTMNNALYIIDAISEKIDKKDRKDTDFKNSIFNSNVIAGLTTYGTFIANMANADTPEKVQAAIEAAALPSGSSSFKKNYRNNIALNAYLGVNAGNWSKVKSPSLTWNGKYRLTAPVGIAWTPIICGGQRGALSVFASILDIGAIVDYQLKKDSTSQEINQKIYLTNIFSPGGYLVYGFPCNIPVSIGFGAQYGPGLIKIGDNLWNPVWKCNFFIGVDIPVFNLNKGKGISK